MAKAANINLKVDPDFKFQVEKLYESFGISVTDAINMFLHVSLMEGGLPFALRYPRYNEQTEAAIAEACGIMAGSIPAKRYVNWSEMQADLDLEQ